jgi:hypothetical protein
LGVLWTKKKKKKKKKNRRIPVALYDNSSYTFEIMLRDLE